MKLRTRFLISLLAVIAVMAVPALYGLRQVHALRGIALDLRERSAQAALGVGRYRAAISDLDRYARAWVATADPQLSPPVRAAEAEARRQLRWLRAAGFGAVIDAVDPPDAELGVLTTTIDSLMAAGELNDATAYIAGPGKALLEKATTASTDLAFALDDETAESARRAQQITAVATTTTTAALLIALVLAAGLALAAAGVLTWPLDRLRRAMGRVANGELEPPDDLPYDRADELGDLFRSFRLMADRLAELDRLKAEFVGAASHDLKTPVSVITGYTQLIEEELAGTLDDRYRGVLRSLGEQTDILRRRLDQLLKISRLEAGAMALSLEEIRLEHFVRALEEEYVELAHHAGLSFTIDVKQGAPPFLIADPDALRTEILGNLIGNAFKFTPAEGAVTVLIHGEGDQIVVDVVDTGPGIRERDLPHVFSKYYQAPGARGIGGSGLGLSIARAAAESHGGRIRVRSRVGRGTTFTLEMPIRAVVEPRPGSTYVKSIGH